MGLRAKKRGSISHQIVTNPLGIPGHIKVVKLLRKWRKSLRKPGILKVKDNTGFFHNRNRKALKKAFAEAKNKMLSIPINQSKPGNLVAVNQGLKKGANNLKQAWKLADQGKPKKALAIVEATLKKYPNDTLALALKGRLIHKRGDKNQALRFLSNAIKKDPSFAMALVWRATVFLEFDKPEMALADCGAALKLKPKNRKARYVRALANAALKNDKAAFDDMSAAFEGNKNRDPLGYYLLVVSALNLHNKPAARRWCKHFEKDFPKHPDLAALKKRMKAIHPLMLRKAPRKQPHR